MPYLSATVSKDKAEQVALDTLSHFFKEMQEKTKVVEEEEEGEDLCNCEFSLAYGMSAVSNATIRHTPSLDKVLHVWLCLLCCLT